MKHTEFVSKYTHMDGHEVKMKKESSFIKTSHGMTYLLFKSDGKKLKCIYLGQSMQNSSIEDLRAAIYQTGESTDELKQVKDKMIQLFQAVEQRLLDEFIQKNFGFIRVSDLEDYLKKNPYINPESI